MGRSWIDFQHPSAADRLLKNENDLRRRILNAEVRAGKWLGDGNEYNDAGNKEMAEKCYQKAQFWHDRYNKLVGNG